jgi:DNA-binding XRE family transcriptional regulator
MPKSAPTQEELNERISRRDEWRSFRREFHASQTKLAKALGVCLRSVQAVEACEVTPLFRTQRLFPVVKARWAGMRAM